MIINNEFSHNTINDDDDDDDDGHHHLLCCVRIRYSRVNVYSARVIFVNHNLEVSVSKNILTVNIKVIFRIKRVSIFFIIQSVILSVHPSIHPPISLGTEG